MSKKPQKFYSMAVRGREADIYIFGDILTPDWKAFDELFGIEASRSGYDIMTETRDLDVDTINVYINSPGGHVSEGLAIHNVLVAHKAEIVTIDAGFACSAASVVFMAGTVRKMYKASLLMIHNAWGGGAGNAKEHRKQADDLEIISATAAEAYKGKINISDAELAALLDNETWISPTDALKWGFATQIVEEEADGRPAASAMESIMRMLTTPQSKPMQADDLLEQLRKDVAAIAAAIPLLGQQQPTPEPAQLPKQEQKPAEPASTKPIDFLSALLGGKEKQ